ncbi:MAG: cytochrome-c oxidase, cbb3-type subunit III [Rickettsiales bacterium]|nr:cytochrome-c oxidase, cbb3-type subunit III [Rickettsiales bacterium]
MTSPSNNTKWVWPLALAAVFAVCYWSVISNGTSESAYKAKLFEKFETATFEEVLNDTALHGFAIAEGKAAFKENCATCHGTDGKGAEGYPKLNDGDWIWGGAPEDIYKTLKLGIRDQHASPRNTLMPPFEDALESDEIGKIADYVLALPKSVDVMHPGYTLFQTNCAACHGSDGAGNRDLGTPHLADGIWLKGTGDRASIVNQIKNPQHDMMPAWEDILDEETLRQLTLYVHSLGGGE